MTARRGALLPLALLLAAAGCCAAAGTLSIALHTPFIPDTGGDGWVKITVSDEAGRAVPAATVSLKSAAGPLGEVDGAAGSQLAALGDGAFGLDFRKLQPTLGLHTLTFAASAGDAAAPDTAIQLVVTGAVELSDASVGVEGGGSRDAQPLTFPHPAPETLSLVSDDAAAKLFLAFTVRRAGEAFRPHQAFVRATHADSGAQAFVRAKAGDSGAHRAAFSAADVTGQADGRGGLYDLALLIGDTTAAAPIEWAIGQVDAPAGQRGGEAAAPAGPLPEIKHQFRAPDKHAPAIISLVFAGLQIALFVALAAALLRDSGLRGLPRTAGGGLAALGFHGGLLAVLALYLLFWVKLSILELLPRLAVAGGVTAVFGYFALSHLASRSVPAGAA